ncbi:hypothetical protein CHUAL_012300 [Chamberlinius hualienensis]
MNRLVNSGFPPGGAGAADDKKGKDGAVGGSSVNVKLFSRVNYTKESVGYNMYSEWTSLHETIQNEFRDLSVLKKFPPSAGREVANAIVRQLAQNLGISSNSQCEPSGLKEDKDVLWCMEVLSYGLGLPLSEHDTIKDSVNVYCEWLMALLKPKICVPAPVCGDANLYARIIIRHFYSLFIPRPNSNADAINRQAVLCHRVLRMLQKIARDSKILVRETWDTMLLFLLAINDTLLAPPTSKGDQLCERIVSVLFEIWLLACAYCFPSPPLWKTFRELSVNWRHRPAVVDQWNRVNIMLTSKLLKFMYEPHFPEIKISEEDLQLLPSNMTNDCIAQSWFRFLHLLGNPIELCNPATIGQTPQFLHYAIISESVVDPARHECLAALPQIFHKAMKGISVLVDSFLGTSQQTNYVFSSGSQDFNKGSASSSLQSITPPQHRKPAKSIGGISAATKGAAKTSLISLTSSKSNINQATPSPTPSSQPLVVFPHVCSSVYVPRPTLAQSRPKCNSILHLFGAWLFEASLLTFIEHPRKGQFATPETKTRGYHETNDNSFDSTVQQYELGIAEAIGALCRIFCAKKTGEGILPVYLARFYIAVQQGLTSTDISEGHILCSILVNSCDLLKLDLDGAMALVPDLIDSIEKVLPERDISIKASLSVPYAELRRSAIHLLMSMLPLPLHFRALPIKDLLGQTDKHPRTFQQYRGRLVNLLISSIYSETDSVNIQMLLGGLLLTIQDSTACEEDHLTWQQDGLNDSTSPLLSSANISDNFRSSNTSNYSSSSADDSDSLLDPFNNDSVYSVFEHALQLVCQRLVSVWRSDLNVSLAALEVLCGLAKIKWPHQDSQRSKRPVKWICDYIVYQCSRPPPCHSKDLHSNIVAAFHSVTIWLLEHPYLLQETDCLATVMEVVELGISGTKSSGGPNEVPCMKGNKDSKPASMRVRDAAESVLTYILERVGYFPSPCGQASVSSLLDEESLLCYCNSWNASRSTNREIAVKSFKYYMIDNSVIVALLEQPLGNDQDPQPTVTVLIRGQFGRHAWAMQLRHLARRKSGMKMHPVNPGRPVPMSDQHHKHNFQSHYFPDSVLRIPLCNCDRSIPALESIISDKAITSDHNKMAKLVEQQIIYEESVKKKTDSEKNEYPNPDTECKPQSVCQEFETARLFLSHFGFLSLESVRETVESKYPSLMKLNTTQPGFSAELEILDSISNRTFDTAFICYQRSGQKTAYDILSNVLSSRNIHPHFLEFLLSLGWPVNVAKHPGWTGHVSTSWKFQESFQDKNEVKDHGGCLYNGQKEVLYWSDATAEIAFVVPTIRQRSHETTHCCSLDSTQTDESKSSGCFERGTLERQSVPPSPVSGQHDISKPRTLSLDLEKPINFKDKESPSDSRGRKIGRQGTGIGCSDTKVLIVWLESYEDRYSCPIGDLLLEMNTGLETTTFPSRTQDKDVAVIFIHLLQNGLFRVEIQGAGKYDLFNLFLCEINAKINIGYRQLYHW